MSEANMENLIKEYLRLQTEKEAIEDKIYPFIHKWCEAIDKWYECVESYDALWFRWRK